MPWVLSFLNPYLGTPIPAVLFTVRNIFIELNNRTEQVFSSTFKLIVTE